MTRTSDRVAALTETERHVRHGARSPDIEDAAYAWVGDLLVAAREVLEDDPDARPGVVAAIAVGEVSGRWRRRS